MAEGGDSSPVGLAGLPAAGPPEGRSAVLRALTALPARVLADPIRRGRLRDVGWPYGLRSVVILAVVAYVIGVGTVAASGLIRASSELTAPTSDVGSVPRAWLWLVLLVVVAALALFQTAALHLPAWLKIIALITSLLMMGSWGLRYSGGGSGLVETVLTGVAMLGLIVLVILRWRRRFTWWEFPVVWLLLASCVVLGVIALNRSAGPLGYDFVPAYLRSTVVTLIPLALPAAVAAGLSVAEITVSATLWSTTVVAKARSVRTVYLVLAAVALARVIQAIWQLWQGDPADLGWPVLGTWALLAAVLAALAILLLLLSRRGGGADPGPGRVSALALPEQMGRMALALGVAVVGVAYAPVVLLGIFGIAGQLAPLEIGGIASSWTTLLTSWVWPAVVRLLVGVALVLLAVRSARRGRLEVALLLAAVAVMLWARVARPLAGGRLDIGSGVGLLNLVATAVVLALLAWFLLRRRLTPTGAVTLSGALVLTLLFGYRDFVSDPLGALLGVSGVALLLFGLTWALLTEAGAANEGSARYPTPSRVLLVLANSVLAAGVAAYVSLLRDPGATPDLGDFALLGEDTLGAALVAAALIAALLAVRQDRPLT
jgi:hypothetical protein